MTFPPVIAYRPELEQFAWTFGGAAPVMRVSPGVFSNCGRKTALRAGCARATTSCRWSVSSRSSTRRRDPSTSRARSRAIRSPSTSSRSSRARLGGVHHRPAVRLLDQHTSDGHPPGSPTRDRVDVAAHRVARLCHFEANESDFSVDLPMVPMHGTVARPRQPRGPVCAGS